MMKKTLLLFVLSTSLFSCSNSNDDTIVNSTDLQKVVFYYNSPNERQWNITNNLLTDITLADGTVVEEFTYDNLSRVIKDVKYSNGSISETTTISYNTDNTINSINGLHYIYNASTQTYVYSYGSNFTINCKVNSDMLAVDFVREGFNASEYHMTYTDGNMTSFEKTTSDIPEVKNFHFDGTYNHANPLRNTILAVARVKSLTDPSFFSDGVVSTGTAGGFDRGASDPYYYSYGYASSITLPPSNNAKNFSIGIEVVDSTNSLVDFYGFAEYYFE